VTVTAIFLNQKRVNVCEHMTKMESLESFFERCHQEVARGMDGGKFKRKLFEVNTRDVNISGVCDYVKECVSFIM
jgi:hypothetical protein